MKTGLSGSSLLAMAAAIFLSAGAGIATAQDREQTRDQLRDQTRDQARDQLREQDRVYGSQLMTQQERNEYRQRMLNAKTDAEREALRHKHHARIQERAKAKGLKLPDEPPAGMDSRLGGGMGNARGR